MMQSYFYHKSFRKYVSAFGFLFNKIEFVRSDENGVEKARERIPLVWGAKQKWDQKLRNDPRNNREVLAQIPRFTFEVNSFEYDPSRKLNNKLYIKKTDNGVASRQQYNGVPYNLGFKLSLWCKNTEEWAQVLEQIVPFFEPEVVVVLKMIPEMDQIVNVPIILNGVDLSDTYDGHETEQRIITVDFNFTMKAIFFAPISNTGIIKHAQSNYYIDLSSDVKLLQYDVEPVSTDIPPIPLEDLKKDDNWTYDESIIDRTND